VFPLQLFLLPLILLLLLLVSYKGVHV
jgi:hypothetical protein